MLDLNKQFRKKEKELESHVENRMGSYFSSGCFKALRSRRERLRDSYDLRFQNPRSTQRAINTWKSKVAMPLAREAMLARRAITLANFKAEPLITLTPQGSTPFENARLAQETLQSNYRSGKFREKAFNDAVSLCSKYGTSILCAQWGTYQTEVTKTLPKKWGSAIIGYERATVPVGRPGCRNKHVSMLNYFQDENVADPDDSDYRGYIDRRRVSDVQNMVDDDNYIQDNVKDVLKKAEKGMIESEHYHSETGKDDKSMHAVDIVYWWGRLNIKGNEGDDTIYYVEKIAGDRIVRIEENPIDENITPLSVFNFDRRDEYWWGNTDAESVIPMENYMTLILNMSADNALRAMQNWIFFDKGMNFNPADLNAQGKSGGFVPFERKMGESVKDLFYQVQFPDAGNNNFQFLSQEIKEAAARVSSKKDFNRRASSGGPQNDTATAALMMDEMGDVQEAYFLTQFSWGLIDNAHKNLVLIQQYGPEKFKVRPNGGNQPATELEKYQIIGDYDYQAHTSLTTNKVVQANKLLNLMTAIQNFKGAGVDQTWMSVQIAPIVRSWLRQLELNVNVDEVFPPESAMPPQMPAMGGPMMPGGIPGQAGPGGQPPMLPGPPAAPPAMAPAPMQAAA